MPELNIESKRKWVKSNPGDLTCVHHQHYSNKKIERDGEDAAIIEKRNVSEIPPFFNDCTGSPRRPSFKRYRNEKTKSII